MKQILLVFLGGGLGSALRYLLTRSLNLYPGIPYGTFTVNILGSLLIGFLFGLSLRSQVVSTNMLLLFGTGFCGGFTTFSTFAYENHIFLKTGDYSQFALYTLGSIILGIGAVFLGMFLSKLA